MNSIRPYKQAIPDILLYQIVTKAVIAGFVLLFELLFRMLLKSTGRVALSSGDFKFLFTTWQGLLIILLGLVFLFMYFAFDMNTKIIMSRRIMDGEKLSVWKCFKEGAVSARKYFSLRGIILIIFITVIAPIAGMEMLISLTEKLQVPNFVMSVIDSKWYFSIPVRSIILIFFLIGIAHIFMHRRSYARCSR